MPSETENSEDIPPPFFLDLSTRRKKPESFLIGYRSNSQEPWVILRIRRTVNYLWDKGEELSLVLTKVHCQGVELNVEQLGLEPVLILDTSIVSGSSLCYQADPLESAIW